MATSTSARSIATLPQQNVVELTSCVDSKIAGVSVYSHRAEVTRTFNFGLTSGQNQVEISGLPTLLIQDSLRVEGKGNGMIQNVTTSHMIASSRREFDTRLLEESEEIKPLRLKKLELEQAIERNDQSKDTLKMYMDSLTSPEAASFSKVVETTGEYDVAMTELQKKGNALAEDLEVVVKALSEKQRTLKDAAKTKWNEKLSLKVSVHILAEVEGEIELSLIYVPKKDAKTYLSAKIQNASEYALLEGPANVYVDGSFIARSTIPAVNPEEKFECALGIYPAIRITYHPLAKKLSQSGLLSKSKVYSYTRRFTIHNTKNSTVEGVKIIDQIPVSEDATITVKLHSPALQLPNFSPTANAGPVSPIDTGSVLNSGKGGLFRNIGGSGNNSNSPSGTPSDKALKAIAKSVKVSPGVVAQWNRPDDLYSITGDGSAEETKVHRSSESVSDSSEPLDLTALGKDGKISWLCSIPPQTKISLTLQWEVSAPVNTDISGI
ncbi:hypothetical protein H1R20_g16507, partial [Candolleomyces eurysporus]